MNHTFDFDDIFTDFMLPLTSPFDSQFKSDAYFIPTFTDCSPDAAIQDEPALPSILEIPEPEEINHVWGNESHTHEDEDAEKPLPKSRKDTAVCDEISQPVLTKEEKRRRRFNETQKNETKNIPKNYGKSILAFIQKQKKLVRQVLQKEKAGSVKDFLQFLGNFKKEITTIADLRELWVDNPYQGVIRTLSCVFLRKYALGYIFNSRVCNYVSHIKYRQRFLEALKSPMEFKHIKDF